MDSLLTKGLFDNLQYWHWFIFAIVLVILEIFSPAAFFIWIGAAAAITGLALLILGDLSWQIQFIIFAIASIASILLGRSFFQSKSVNTDDPTLSQLEKELIGKVCEVEQAIHNGSGRVKVGETTWKATGADCEAGQSVRVIAVDGAILEVTPI
jgi:membrane protein implicated in regulation of membrane protease activity